MLFTVIVPAYNAARYLEAGLLSLEAQTYRDFEVVIIDDGSTDETGAIAEAFSASAGNVSVVHKDNEGVLRARCDGIARAQGTYTVFLDADDCLAPHALALLAARIAETGSDIVQYAFCQDPAFRHRIKTFDLPDGKYQGKDFAYVRRQLLAGKMNSIWSRAVRTSLLRADGFPSDRFKSVMHGEDILQSLYTFDRAASATILAEALYYYRPNDDASTASYRLGQLAGIEVVCRELLEVARRWGSDYVPYAMQGAAMQYAYLLNILIGSTDKDISTELERIAESFERLGGLEVVRGAEAIRVDCLIMLKLLCRRRFRVLRRFAGSIECVRRQTRRLLSR